MPKPPHGIAIMFHSGPQFAREDEAPDEDHLGREQDQHSDEPPELSERELDQAIEMCEAELKMLHALRNGDRVAARKWAERWHELGGSNGGEDDYSEEHDDGR